MDIPKKIYLHGGLLKWAVVWVKLIWAPIAHCDDPTREDWQGAAPVKQQDHLLP